jgi:activating signal cointegrator 1
MKKSKANNLFNPHDSFDAVEGKALSLLQPWASLVVMGLKKIETRSWQTAHRGPLLIHASLGKKGKVLANELPFSKYIADFDALPFGAIIGQVELEDILPVEHLFYSAEKLAALTLEEKAFGDYTRGRYAWMFSEPVMFDEMIPVKGGLGIWTFKIEKAG